MNYAPYGYTINNGNAIIVEREAEQVKEMFSCYLTGFSLTEVAKATGISKPHSSIGKMLRNRRYVGDGLFPPLIDEDTFQKVEVERLRRAKLWGRIREPEDKKVIPPNVSFRMPIPKQIYEDPFVQAEYAYGLIECEEAKDAE